MTEQTFRGATLDLLDAIPLLIRSIREDEEMPASSTDQQIIQTQREQLDMDEVDSWTLPVEILDPRVHEAYRAVVGAELGRLNRALAELNISPVTQ